MIKKELKDIIKPVLLRVVTGALVIFIIFTALRIFGERDVSFFTDIIYFYTILFWIPILWISYNLGINMFKKEQNDHAMEYLLSSPFTKSGILIKKFIPRLIILLALVLFYSVILNIQDFSGIIQSKLHFGLLRIIFIIFMVFFCSVFLSLYEWGNIKGLAWIIITFPVFNLNLILHHIFDKNIVVNNNIILSVNTLNLSLIIITIILGIGFFFVFHNFDIRSSKIFKIKFTLISGIPLIIIVLISFIIGITKNI